MMRRAAVNDSISSRRLAMLLSNDRASLVSTEGFRRTQAFSAVVRAAPPRPSQHHDDEDTSCSLRGGGWRASRMLRKSTCRGTANLPHPPFVRSLSTGSSASPNPTFRIIRVSYDTGDIETLKMTTSDLVQSSGVLVRDLLTLNLTATRGEPHHYRHQKRPRRHQLSEGGSGTPGGGIGRLSHPQLRTMGEIMPRNENIVVSFGNIRAIVGLTCVYLADAQDPNVELFARELSNMFRLQSTHSSESSPSSATDPTNLHGQTAEALESPTSPTIADIPVQPTSSSQDDPKELVFLEQLLKDTVDSYLRRLRIYEPIVDNFLDKIDSEVYSDTGVHLLVPLKDSLNGFELQVKQSYECLTGLLQHDDLMLALLLTEQEQARNTGQPVEFSRHEHVELLLGVYARQLANVRLETQYLLGRLQAKQEFVALALAGYRNRLIRVNVHLGIVTVALGVGTATAGFFGMNLINGLEHVPGAFATVVAMSGLGGILITAGSLNYLSGRSMKRRAVQRLDEIETLTSALSDLCAVDYAIKSVTEEGKALNRDQFRLLLSKARKFHTTEKEVDILFNVLDKVPDGSLTTDDFHAWPGPQSAGSRRKQQPPAIETKS